jgi:outer membrane protein assembly factor BamD (BamD/ComL family)
MTRFEPSDVRLASFVDQVQALRYGEASADSVRGLLESLINEYPHGDVAPVALFSMAKCAYELGDDVQAHRDLARLVRNYPTAPVIPEGQLLRAQMYADEGNMRDAQRTLRALPLEFPTSPAALRAPLEVAAHYRNLGDAAGERHALTRAEQRYREILERYPRGPHGLTTRSNLVTVLTMLGRNAEAVDELLAMCDGIAPRAQQPVLLSAAAQKAETVLADTERAARIYERLAEEFPHTRLGRAAVRDARRLTEANKD